MRPRSVFLVRHGQSAANIGGLSIPNPVIPLTDAGRQQAMGLAERLPAQPPRVLASPFLRAMDTAKPYAQRTGQAIEGEPLLHEFDMIDHALIAGMDHVQRRPVSEAYWEAADPDKRMGDEAERSGLLRAGFRRSWPTGSLPCRMAQCALGMAFGLPWRFGSCWAF